MHHPRLHLGNPVQYLPEDAAIAELDDDVVFTYSPLGCAVYVMQESPDIWICNELFWHRRPRALRPRWLTPTIFERFLHRCDERVRAEGLFLLDRHQEFVEAARAPSVADHLLKARSTRKSLEELLEHARHWVRTSGARHACQQALDEIIRDATGLSCSTGIPGQTLIADDS